VNDKLDVIMYVSLFVMLVLAAFMFVVLGASIMMAHECKVLGYDHGGIDITTLKGFCEYEPLRVPLEELLKEATS
jgi:hypothetical protein